MTTAAGIIETVGNLAALIVATVWAGIAWRARLKAPAMLLASLAVWCGCGVFYGLAYVGRTRGWWEWWDTTTETIVEAAQQLTQVAAPIAGIAVLATFIKDRWNVLPK